MLVWCQTIPQNYKKIVAKDTFSRLRQVEKWGFSSSDTVFLKNASKQLTSFKQSHTMYQPMV